MGLGPAYGDGFAGKANKATAQTLYIAGDESTDGSIRFVPDIDLGVNAELQQRARGAWNNTGLTVAASTIHIGHEVKLSGVGDWMIQTDADGGSRGVIPHTEFDETLGTSLFPHVANLSGLVTRLVVQPDESTEQTGTHLTYVGSAPVDRISSSVYYHTGATAATEPVKMTVATGNFAASGGQVVFRWTFPTDEWPASSEIKLLLDGQIEFAAGELVYADFESDAAFSMKFNAAGTFPWLALDYHTVEDTHIVTFEAGIDRILTSSVDLHPIIDQLGNLITWGETL